MPRFSSERGRRYAHAAREKSLDQLALRTDHSTSGRNSSHLTPVSFSMVGQRSAGTRVRDQWPIACLVTPSDFANLGLPPIASAAREIASITETVKHYSTQCKHWWPEPARCTLTTMETGASEIIEKLKEGLALPGKSLIGLQKATGKSRQAVYAWLKTGRIAKKHIPAVCRYFGRPIAWLWGEDEEFDTETMEFSRAFSLLNANERRRWKEALVSSRESEVAMTHTEPGKWTGPSLGHPAQKKKKKPQREA